MKEHFQKTSVILMAYSILSPVNESVDHCDFKIVLCWIYVLPFPMPLTNELQKWNDLWFDNEYEFDYSEMETHLQDAL